MAKLMHNGKTILNNMSYLNNLFSISKGLMFASKNKVKNGACLVIPKNTKPTIHMFFCFYPYEILFVDENYQVRDKKLLKPWTMYSSKNYARYVLESLPGTFKDIKIGDKIKIIIP